MIHSDTPRVAIAQDGARLHYAVPLALQNTGILDRVYCDWYARPWSLCWCASQIIRMLKPGLGKRMLDRYAVDLDRALVHDNPWLAICHQYSRRKFATDEAFFNWASSNVSRWIKRRGFGQANVLYGFIRNLDPELLQYAHERGLKCIGDQIIAPYAMEYQESIIQRERFPEWSSEVDDGQELLVASKEQSSWTQLDHITCASSYVQQGLVAQKVPASKISVLPYPINAELFPLVNRSGRKGPIHVGFVGAVNLRKGTPYFLEVARHFDPEKVRFTMVGPVALNASIVEKYRGHVELTGAVPRSDVRLWLSRFDIYFFPSTCEGSAGSIMEAMATGLPIVTTPNSGSIVQDGTNGFINHYDDIQAFVKVLTMLSNSDYRIAMGMRARKAAELTNILAYGRQLRNVVERVLGLPPSLCSSV